MIYVECPNTYTGQLPIVFLAGGITGCPDWQSTATDLFDDLPIAVANPRRANFPIHDPGASGSQILWQYDHLNRAAVKLFWFPASGPTPQPIALYELGKHAAGDSRITVGADPNYIRRADILIQLHLLRPDVEVRDNLAQVCQDTRTALHTTTLGTLTP